MKEPRGNAGEDRDETSAATPRRKRAARLGREQEDALLAAIALSVQVGWVLSAGLRTGDIWSEGTRKVGAREMGDAVVAAITGKTITKT